MTTAASPDSLSDAALTERCLTDATIDPWNCPCLLSGGGPEMNTDVSGPGVRISFYLQALFLALLAARSGSLEEISGALYTLIATNVSMAVTSLILGFKANRGMSLHDAIVVFYLLAGSWLAIFFSLPSYNRFVKSDTTLQVLTIIHSYIVFAFILAVLITARTFGNAPRCNSHAVAVLFYHFPANAGRIAAFVFVCLIICIYTFLSFSDYYRVAVDEYNRFKIRQKKKAEQEARGEANIAGSSPNGPGTLVTLVGRLPDVERGFTDPGPSSPTSAPSLYTNVNVEPDEARRKQANTNLGARKKRRVKERDYTNPNAADPRGNSQEDQGVFITGVLGSLLIEIIVIVVLWALFVLNSELVIRWNRFDGGGDGDSADLWGFGQILPMFLVLLPFVQLVKAFKKWKLRKRVHRTRKHKRGLTAHEKARRNEQRHSYTYGHGHTHDHTRGYRHGHRHVPGAGIPSSFFPTAGGPSNNTFGNQPFAHISVNSVHSIPSEPHPRKAKQEDEVASSRRSSTSSASVSDSLRSSSVKVDES